MRPIEKTGPTLPVLPATDADCDGTPAARAPPQPPLRSILRVRGGEAPGLPAHASSADSGDARREAPRRMSLQEQFTALKASMPVADAQRIMSEMARTRSMAARLQLSVEATARELREDGGTTARTMLSGKERKQVHFADDTNAGGRGAGRSSSRRARPKHVRFADDDALGHGARRLHLRRGERAATGRARIERVEYFSQHRAEKDMSFVRPCGHGRREMRRRLLQAEGGMEEDAQRTESRADEVEVDEAEDSWMRRRAAEHDVSARYTSLDGAIVENSVSMQPQPEPAAASAVPLDAPLPTTTEAVDAEIAQLKAILAASTEPLEAPAESSAAPPAVTTSTDDT